jgi:hypothetical protein
MPGTVCYYLSETVSYMQSPSSTHLSVFAVALIDEVDYIVCMFFLMKGHVNYSHVIPTREQ